MVMGFIQPILIASAALAVLASTSELESRASHADDLNINDVSNVAANVSDVVPTDWAYQALSNLVESKAASLVTPTARSAATGR